MGMWKNCRMNNPPSNKHRRYLNKKTGYYIKNSVKLFELKNKYLSLICLLKYYYLILLNFFVYNFT